MAESTKRNPWYSIRETGCPRFPQYFLTHYNDEKEYSIMLLSWDVETQKPQGWFVLAARKTIREAREYVKTHLVP